LPKPDFLLTAGYGKLVPESWLSFPNKMSVNLHLSLLPDFRGANPAEWGLLLGMEKTGVTLIEMSPEFDTGKILAQAEIPVHNTDDTRETIYEKLYALGGKHIAQWISNVDALPKIPQTNSVYPYAARFLRDDGFMSWHILEALVIGKEVSQDSIGQDQLMGKRLYEAWSWCRTHSDICKTESLAVFVARASRALRGFPRLWTLAPTPKGPKRLKIHLATTEKHNGTDLLKLENVQLEGQQPATWAQIKNAISL
jgi:methionyl-tRNA formyltransferase